MYHAAMRTQVPRILVGVLLEQILQVERRICVVAKWTVLRMGAKRKLVEFLAREK